MRICIISNTAPGGVPPAGQRRVTALIGALRLATAALLLAATLALARVRCYEYVFK